LAKRSITFERATDIVLYRRVPLQTTVRLKRNKSAGTRNWQKH